MEFEYFSEENISIKGDQKVTHYLFNLERETIIQTGEEDFSLRNEPLLQTYLHTILNGRTLPGFTHLGKISISDEQIKPVLDVLSYKAHVEARLNRVNRAISVQAERILSHIQTTAHGTLGS